MEVLASQLVLFAVYMWHMPPGPVVEKKTNSCRMRWTLDKHLRKKNMCPLDDRRIKCNLCILGTKTPLRKMSPRLHLGYVLSALAEGGTLLSQDQLWEKLTSYTGAKKAWGSSSEMDSQHFWFEVGHCPFTFLLIYFWLKWFVCNLFFIWKCC